MMRKSKTFLNSVLKTLLHYCIRNYLSTVYELRFTNNALRKFIKDKYLEYEKIKRDSFNLWKIKNLKLEKIGLLKFFSSKLIIKRCDMLAKLILKKYFDLMRSKALKLKKTESFLKKISSTIIKQKFQFLQFQIYLKKAAGKRLKKLFSNLSEAQAEETQRKYYMRWLKNVYKEKISLALLVNMRNRLHKLETIRSSPKYLLNKYFNLWLENFSLHWKFNRNLLNRNSAAVKIINLIRFAKWKLKILKTRRIKTLLKRRLSKLKELSKPLQD